MSTIVVALLVAGGALLLLGAVALFRIQGSGTHKLKVAGVEISSTNNALFILGLGVALLAMAAFTAPDDAVNPTTTATSQTTPEPDATTTVAETAEVASPIDVALSGHIWSSSNLGSPDVLEGLTYEYRAGVSHVEDLPPAGSSITALTFDLSPLIGAARIVGVELDLTPTRVEGDPFGAYGELLVERVEFTSVLDARSSTGPLLLRSGEAPGLVDVTDAVKQVIGLDQSQFQVRLRFQVSLTRDEEFTAPNAFIEWDYPEGPTLVARVRR